MDAILRNYEQRFLVTFMREAPAESIHEHQKQVVQDLCFEGKVVEAAALLREIAPELNRLQRMEGLAWCLDTMNQGLRGAGRLGCIIRDERKSGRVDEPFLERQLQKAFSEMLTDLSRGGDSAPVFDLFEVFERSGYVTDEMYNQFIHSMSNRVRVFLGHGNYIEAANICIHSKKTYSHFDDELCAVDIVNRAFDSGKMDGLLIFYHFSVHGTYSRRLYNQVLERLILLQEIDDAYAVFQRHPFGCELALCNALEGLFTLRNRADDQIKIDILNYHIQNFNRI